MHLSKLVLVSAGLLATLPAAAQQDTEGRSFAEQVNAADYRGGPLPDGQSPLTARVQVRLDRAHASPGVIDGYAGENVSKAIRAFEEYRGFEVDGRMDQAVWRAIDEFAGDPLVRHAITEDDVSNIVDPLPDDYEELAERDWLGYTSAAEKIAETFHMDIESLKILNPDADFSAVGTEIWIAAPGEDAEAKVVRIVADKSLARVLAYNAEDNLVLSYPTTIGSAQTPSPSGTHEVEAVAVEANYTYRPEENYQQGDNDEELVLAPGPNNPVGLVWIDLSKPTYGIHGTPDPAEIDKESSHGCVRLTNWDAMELAHAVEVGATVEFKE